MLRRLFRPKRDGVSGGWRKLRNVEFCDLFSLSSVIRMIKSRRMGWTEHAARMGEKNAYKILVGEPEGRRLLGRPGHRWVNNIRMDLGETGWGGMGWISLAQDRDKWRALVNVA
jgi:hypothetical protein